MQTSSRRGISFPSLDRSDRPDIPLHIKNLVDALELDPSLAMGAAGARPANPGYPRYFYWATDTKVLSFWDGSSWTNVGSVDLIPQTLIDAKGDLLVGLTDNTAGKLGVGNNNFLLTADSAQSQGMKWALNAVIDAIAAKGDILAGTGLDALTRVAVGPNGTTIIADSAQAAGLKWGVPLIPSQVNQLIADVTMTLANTFYDGPALTLAAGTWFLNCVVTATRGGASGIFTTKLWDGSNVFGSAGENPGNNGDPTHLAVTGVAVLGSTTTVKASVTYSGTGGIIKAAAPTNSAGNNASTLVALQLA
jgi:hypothetical protein